MSRDRSGIDQAPIFRATAPRRTLSPMSTLDRVLVLGGSAAGLFSAGALAPLAREIVLVERDRLPVDTAHRKGTPQSRHANNLLPRANDLLEAWFPGIIGELVARGAVLAGSDSRFVVNGNRLAPIASGASSLLMTRPLLDEALRRRVQALPNVKVLDGHDVTGLVVDRTARAILGARVRPVGAVEDVAVEADLVVDAMGRGSRASGWLDAEGWSPPPSIELKVGVRYVTRLFTRAPTDAAGDKLLIVSPAPGIPRGAVAFAVEGERWLVTIYAYGETPPSDVEGFRAFVASLVAPDIGEAITTAEPIGEPASFHYPVVRVRRFDEIASPPAGYVALGDALANLSPSYGQGMTSAALQADALARALARRSAAPARRVEGPMLKRFYREAVAAASNLFGLGWSNDSLMPGFEGPKDPTPAPIRWYVRRAMRVAQRDPFVSERVRRVAGGLAAPASLLTPRVAWRVLVAA